MTHPQVLSLKSVGGSLSKSQKGWRVFCLTAMIFTNTINWKAWKRWSGGKYSDSTLSKMLRWALIPWSLLLLASTRLIISRYGINEGILVIDASDHQKSKTSLSIKGFLRQKTRREQVFQSTVLCNIAFTPFSFPMNHLSANRNTPCHPPIIFFRKKTNCIE